MALPAPSGRADTRKPAWRCPARGGRWAPPSGSSRRRRQRRHTSGRWPPACRTQATRAFDFLISFRRRVILRRPHGRRWLREAPKRERCRLQRRHGSRQPRSRRHRALSAHLTLPAWLSVSSTTTPRRAARCEPGIQRLRTREAHRGGYQQPPSPSPLRRHPPSPSPSPPPSSSPTPPSLRPRPHVPRRGTWAAAARPR